MSPDDASGVTDAYPASADPEKVDRRAWVRENLSAIPIRENDLPPSIIDVVRAVAHLANPDRVILFGSRARGDANRFSDFDLYVEGVRDDKGLRTAVLDATTGYLTLRQVDIVPENEASTSLRAEVAREGRVLFERED